MIGLVFSQLGGAQNIGYIIPCEEIELFLADIADGKVDGKPTMDDELQTLENPALRAFLKLDKVTEGRVLGVDELARAADDASQHHRQTVGRHRTDRLEKPSDPGGARHACKSIGGQRPQGEVVASRA